MTSRDYFFIQDDDFLTDQEKKELQICIFDENASIKPSWRVTNVLSILDRMSGEREFPYSPTPLAINSSASKPLLQMIGDIDLNDFPPAKMAFERFCTKHNIPYDKIIRARVNVLPSDNEEKHHYIHVDNIISHKVFLYYFHDSDGDTLFFNKKFGDSEEGLEVVDRVSPVGGRAISFEGHQFHSSSAPSKHPFRSVLNIDFTTKR